MCSANIATSAGGSFCKMNCIVDEELDKNSLD